MGYQTARRSAYRLLKSAGITKEQEQLAKATVGQFTFSAMCAKLKSIFGDTIKADPPTSGNGAAIRVVKTEEEAYCENTYFSRDKQQEYRGRFRDVGRRNNNFRNQRGYVRGNWNQTPNNRLQKNPTNAQGEVTSCNICQGNSIFFSVSGFPTDPKNENLENKEKKFFQFFFSTDPKF